MLQSSIVFLVALSLAGQAPAASASESTSVLIMDLDARGGASADDARTINDLVVVAISSRPDISAVGGDDLRNLLALAGEKEAVGCDSVSESCMAEIASALGARWVVFGRLSVLGDQTILQLNLMDAANAKPVAREQVIAANAGALTPAIGPAVSRLVEPVTGGVGGTNVTDLTRDGAGSDGKSSASLVTYAGLGGAGLGAVLFVMGGIWGALTARDVVDASAKASDRNASRTLSLMGFTVGALGGVVMVAGLGVAGFGMVTE